MNYKNFLQSSKAKHIIAGIGIAFIALVIFQAGVFVGFRKAEFSGRMGDNYYKTFGEQRGPRGMMPNFGMMDPSNSHGTIGKIVSTTLPQVIIADQDGTEKTIIIDTKTDIRSFRDSIKAEALKVGDFITVIGEPNKEGQIEARLIRIMPEPPVK
jgi:hypothetical protein